MKRFGWICLGCVVLLQCSYAFADEPDHWQKICTEVSKVAFPPQDRPSPEAAKSLANCSSVDLYFGIGMSQDLAQARQCAFVEIDKGDELTWGGSSILMMIYANGLGADRNFNLAIKLACQNDLAPGGGQKFRVVHLAKLRQENWNGHDLSICDDTTSGYWQGNCAWLAERIVSAKRKTQLTQLNSAWSNSDQKALVVLNQVFDRFVQCRTEHEVDSSGTARAALAIEEESSLRKEFLTKLESLEHNSPPRFTADQFTDADHELNNIYHNIQSKSDFSYGTVSREGIKETQRTWLKYRDAWVAFGQQKYPNVSAASWKTWLTQERTRMLKELLE